MASGPERVQAALAALGLDTQVIRVPGSAKTAQLAALRGADSAAMAPAAVVREATGYAIGGVPPLGHATALPVYLDQALLRWPVVYGAAGAPDALFPIESQTLLTVTGAEVVDVSE